MPPEFKMAPPVVSVEGSDMVLRFSMSSEEEAQRMARRIKRFTGLFSMMTQVDNVFGDGDL